MKFCTLVLELSRSQVTCGCGSGGAKRPKPVIIIFLHAKTQLSLSFRNNGIYRGSMAQIKNKYLDVCNPQYLSCMKYNLPLSLTVNTHLREHTRAHCTPHTEVAGATQTCPVTWAAHSRDVHPSALLENNIQHKYRNSQIIVIEI